MVRKSVGGFVVGSSIAVFALLGCSSDSGSPDRDEDEQATFERAAQRVPGSGRGLGNGGGHAGGGGALRFLDADRVGIETVGFPAPRAARARTVTCTDAADCAGGNVCCAQGHIVDAGGKRTIRNFGGAQCAARCDEGSVALCRSAAGCGGKACTATSACGMSLAICQ